MASFTRRDSDFPHTRLSNVRSRAGSAPPCEAEPFGPADIEALVYELLGASLVLAEDWERLAPGDRDLLLSQRDRDDALAVMARTGLLTPFQAARLGTGNTFGLVLGNFRLLERLGAGGMAVVYKAEHIEMRHLVAIKVLHLGRDDDPRLETRFSAEMRAIARLRHPNIVGAMDSGRAYSPDPDGPVLWYLVMEYVPGEDLEGYVHSRGPLPPARACNLIHQIACALAETHKLHLVHRDIKPSNILVTPEEQAKLLDFGLSRHVPTKLTQPGTVLGTLDYMAPEQAKDASQVDIRADLWSLGATLYWCLTAQLPFPGQGSDMEILIRRLTQQPPSIRAVQPSLPGDLDALVRKMMALDPRDRHQAPQEVMQALLPFLKPESTTSLRVPTLGRNSSATLDSKGQLAFGARTRRVLIVDDEPSIRLFCREVMRLGELETLEAPDGEEALRLTEEWPPDLALIDVQMPGMTGPELLRRLRANPPTANLKVIMFSGQTSGDEMSGMLMRGADDYLSKPFSVPQLLGRVQSALRLKDAQDRSDLLNQHLLAVNEQLERSLTDRASDLSQVRTALVLGLARLVNLRENDQGNHLTRMSRYVRVLAEEARKHPPFAAQIDQTFIDMASCCAPLHDIGKVGLPDHILLKPGKLSSDERLLMQAHTTMPAEMLVELAQTYGAARAFLLMAGDLIRHHHERWDGTGYPDRLAGPAIPLSGRLVAIGDVYDALRSRRSWKPALSHAAALGLMTESSPGQFDPALLEAFVRCAGEFEAIFRELPG
jgi:response regulator RpfG family c-di-GMP phosphodiesterase/serine/threonine protein kinase